MSADICPACDTRYRGDYCPRCYAGADATEEAADRICAKLDQLIKAVEGLARPDGVERAIAKLQSDYDFCAEYADGSSPTYQMDVIAGCIDSLRDLARGQTRGQSEETKD